ncbi:hypothetical protein D3C74_29730 [compost metagenome]
MKLEDIVSAVTGVPAGELNDEAGRATLPQWDSMAHINLITAVEETYSVSFTIEEIQEVNTVGGLRALLQQKGAAA